MRTSPSKFWFLTIVLLCSCCHSNAAHNYKDDPQLTPLMNASRQNDLPRIRTLLAQGADVKAKTAQGQTALYEAIERTDLNADNLPIVAALLQAGADPNEKEIFGASALSISLTRDYANPSVTLLLLKAGAIVPHECPPQDAEDSLVSLATMDSSVEVMRELIAKGGPVNCKYRGASALYWAALNGQSDRVELLLQSSADPREQYDGGHTILDIATTTNRDSRVQKEFAKTRQLLEIALQPTAQLPGDNQRSAPPAAMVKAQSTLVGILEDNPGHYSGDPHYRDVRAAFQHDKSGWMALPNNCPNQSCLTSITTQFPAQVNWTIAFSGRELGHVLSRTPQSFDFYSSIGQQSIVGSTAPPTIGKPSAEFAGFLGEPVYRPLVAVSEPNYRDPENWKPTQPSPEVISAVRKAFRDRFPKVKNCTRQDVEHAKPWSYHDANIRINATYSSSRHWLIAELILDGYECDGPSDEPFSSQWFVITPEQQVRFLDSNMWLVDAGDYVNDGKSELIFSIDGYNRGGYKLYYDDFRQDAVFEFNYH
jgi:hypothetical protein